MVAPPLPEPPALNKDIKLAITDTQIETKNILRHSKSFFKTEVTAKKKPIKWNHIKMPVILSNLDQKEYDQFTPKIPATK